MTTIDEATIEQQIAEAKATLAALEAKRADPWATAVSRYMDAADVPYADREAVKAGLIAALPLAPRQVEAPQWPGEDELLREAVEVLDAILQNAEPAGGIAVIRTGLLPPVLTAITRIREQIGAD